MEQREQLSLSKKLVVVGACVSFTLGLLLLAQGFIDTKDYREQIIEAVKERTGKDVTLKGKVEARLLPTPGLFIPGIELRGYDEKDPAPNVTVGAISIKPALLSLFSDNLRISSVTLENPSLEIRRAEDGVVHWDWLNKSFLGGLIAYGGADPVSVNIVDGKILYRNDKDNQGFSLKHINVQSEGGTNPHATGVIEVGERTLQFDIDTSPGKEPPPEGMRPLSITIETGTHDKLQFSGGLDMSGENPRLKGKTDIAIADLLPWLTAKTPDAPAEPAAPMPLAFSGAWSQDGWVISVDDFIMSGLDSTGGGTLNFNWEGLPALTADLHYSEIKYSGWQPLVQAFTDRIQQERQRMYAENDERDTAALPEHVKMTLKLAADKLIVSEQTWEKATLSATLEDAAITVNQFNIELPDAATLTLFGIISQSGTKSLRFEGSLESQGKSLRNLLTIFDASAAELPATGFGDFYIHSNIFVSPEQMRLSEADVKLNDLRLSGGLVGYFDTKPRIEADVKLKDINFDYFRDIWREEQKQTPTQDKFISLERSLNFNWLKHLKTNIDFKVIVDKFTFLERQGDSAAFRLFAQEGEFGIYNMRFYYPGDTIEANFNLNAKNETPYVTLVLNTSNEFNTNYFAITPPDPAAPAAPAEGDDKERWSKKLIDMSWMEGYNGSFDLSFGKLTHGDKNFNRFKMKSQLTNKLLTIQALSFGYWQGRCDVTGTLYGGKVPGLSIGFTLTNADLKDIIAELSERKNITGRLGVSGTLSTSGVNMVSWVSQADSKLVINGVGVNVNNFNLQGVVDTVAVSRTTADVVNNVNLVLQKGNTEFSVEGYLNIKNGSVRTPGLTLKSGNITGNLTGDIKLLPWTMQLSTLFQFPAMTSETVPTMKVELSGSVEDAQLRADTDSLEAYVSKRIVGQ